MLPELRDGFESLQRRKADLIARVAALDPAERTAAPARGEWSPLQIVQHLLHVEGLSAGPEVALPPDSAARPRPGTGMLAKLLAASMRAAIRLPSPDAIALPPDDGADLDALDARWGARREDLRARLEAVKDPDRMFARHPIAGPLSARQVLDLCDSHLVYHQKRFPKVGRSSAARSPAG